MIVSVRQNIICDRCVDLGADGPVAGCICERCDDAGVAPAERVVEAGGFLHRIELRFKRCGDVRRFAL